MNGLCFQISDWTLVVEENKLYRQDREVTVEPRLVNLLSFLAQSPGDVFCREELIDHVWDGAIVTDQVVTQSIFELRKILKDGRADCVRFIVTVPKRGYKLVADTRQLTLEEMAQGRPADTTTETVSAAPESSESKETEVETTPDPDPVMPVFPAAPLTRAVTHFSKQIAAQEAKQDRELSVFQRYKLQIFDILLVFFSVVVIFLCTYTQTTPRITKAIDINVIEFSHHLSQNSDRTSEYLADGISQKLMADISSFGKYRVQLKKANFTTGILPGKAVSVRIDRRQGKTYLDVQYRNNSSNRVVFSRQYLLSDNALRASLREASADLIAALAIKATDAQIDHLMLGIPQDPVVLTKLIKANHFISQQDTELFEQGITLLNQVIASEPDNTFVLAERYIAYNVLSALEPELELSTEITSSGRALTDNYNQNPAQDLPARVYEAFALQAINQDEVELVRKYLDLAANYRRSSLYYVISGKLAELVGDLDRAGEAYSQAFYINTSMEVYKLCQNLAFYSNLETVAYFMHRAVNPSEAKLL